jgi:hypothetical protein
VRLIDMLNTARRRPAEYCWTNTCREFDAAEKAGVRLGYDHLRHLTMTALDRCRTTGQLSASQVALLVEFGVSGPPRADSAKRLVWDRALDILDSEMNRMVFPASAPPKAQHFFYGSNGTAFVNAAEAWFWTLDCLEARAEGSRAESAMKIGRPCDPDDVVNAMRRLELSPIHARTVVAWGKKRTAPPASADVRRFWDEAMERLRAVLVEKGIVRGRKATPEEIMDLPLAYARSLPASGPRRRDAVPAAEVVAVAAE